MKRFRSGNLIEVLHKEGSYSPFKGYCIKCTSGNLPELTLFNRDGGITKSFALREELFDFKVLNSHRLKQGRAYFLERISLSKLRKKLKR